MNTPGSDGRGGGAPRPSGPAAPPGAGTPHARRLAQTGNSPRTGQPTRDATIPGIDPDEALEAATLSAGSGAPAPAGELARWFGLLDRWLPDFRTLPEDWA